MYLTWVQIFIWGVLTMALICWWWCKMDGFHSNVLKNIPGPPIRFLFGNALEVGSLKDLLQVLMNAHEKYGSLYKGWIGPQRSFLIIADHHFLEFLFNSTKTNSKALEYRFFRGWLGTGLLTSKGDKWKKHRRMITPSFHFQILEQFVYTFESASNILIQKLKSEVGKDTFNVYSYITLNSLDIICESSMGTSVDAQINEDSDYVYSVKEICRIIMDRSISPFKMYDFLYKFSRDYHKEKKALYVLHTFSKSVISSRRKELSNNLLEPQIRDEIGSKRRTAFLDLLLNAVDIDGTKLTDEEIREEVDTFMFEGHDTTSSGISFALYCLANNPVEQNRALQEQRNLFGNDKNPHVNFQDLQNMKYLEMVIKESLRLFPPVPLYSRELEGDIEYESHTLPKGLTLVINAFGIQRSSTYFPNPEKFDPERHAETLGRPVYSYIPFSAGPRNCIGQRFAMLQMKYVISRLLRNFELMPAIPEFEPVLLCQSILKSENGIHIKIEDRILG